MSLTVDLAPDGAVIARTEHGFEVRLDDLDQLARMLKRQREPKVLPGITSDNAHLVLAEWERIGPEGAGKVLKPPLRQGGLRRLPDEDRFNFADGARQYSKSGKLVRLSARDPIPDL